MGSQQPNFSSGPNIPSDSADAIMFKAYLYDQSKDELEQLRQQCVQYYRTYKDKELEARQLRFELNGMEYKIHTSRERVHSLQEEKIKLEMRVSELEEQLAKQMNINKDEMNGLNKEGNVNKAGNNERLISPNRAAINEIVQASKGGTTSTHHQALTAGNKRAAKNTTVTKITPNLNEDPRIALFPKPKRIFHGSNGNNSTCDKSLNRFSASAGGTSQAIQNQKCKYACVVIEYFPILLMNNAGSYANLFKLVKKWIEELVYDGSSIAKKLVKISASLKFFAPGSTWTNEEKGALFLYFDGIDAAKNFVDATTDGSTTISDQNGIEYNFKPKSQHSEQYSGNNLPTHGYGPGNAKDSDEW